MDRAVLIFLTSLGFTQALLPLPPNEIISVQTPVGEIKGCEEELTFMDKTAKVNKFLGIPYAEPPVGDLRFQKPVSIGKFSIPIEALTPGNACLQPEFDQDPDGFITYSEDCLYLNVYTPSLDSSGKKYAVMIYISGSDFESGYSDKYQPDNIVIQGEVIVVTFNYRVSVWGFMSTGDEEAAGNYGLWDQQLVIQWVYNNIQSFGGDNSKITLFGNGAGAVSAIYQALYPGNYGLFKRIISQSGAPGTWFASNENAGQSATLLAPVFGCKAFNRGQMKKCLKDVDGKRFVNLVSDRGAYFTDIPSIFLPRQDNDFISFDPRLVFESDFVSKLTMTQRKSLSSVDILAGINTGDGGIAISSAFGVFDQEKFLPLREYFETNLVPFLKNLGLGDVDDVVKNAIIFEYTNWNDTDSIENVREEYLEMHRDFAFTKPLYNTLDVFASLSSTNNTYMYIFDVDPSIHSSVEAKWMDKPSNKEEIPFVFGFKNSNRVAATNIWLANPWEMRFSRDIITLWTNFAKSGNPNLPMDLGIGWKPYTVAGQHYLHITDCLASASVKQHWNLRRANFWTKILPQMVRSTECNKQGRPWI